MNNFSEIYNKLGITNSQINHHLVTYLETDKYRQDLDTQIENIHKEEKKQFFRQQRGSIATGMPKDKVNDMWEFKLSNSEMICIIRLKAFFKVILAYLERITHGNVSGITEDSQASELVGLTNQVSDSNFIENENPQNIVQENRDEESCKNQESNLDLNCQEIAVRKNEMCDSVGQIIEVQALSSQTCQTSKTFSN